MNPVAPVTRAVRSVTVRTVAAMGVSVYFKPDCSNCQTAEGILREKGIDAEYIRYLENAPTREQLEEVLAKLGTDDPREVIRTKEPEYKELGLSDATRDELLDAMVAHPILIQRPIVISGNKAVVARPPERLLTLFE
jgi:arsenate reductase